MKTRKKQIPSVGAFPSQSNLRKEAQERSTESESFVFGLSAMPLFMKCAKSVLKPFFAYFFKKWCKPLAKKSK
jgi:hypothetical protein